MRVLIDSFVRLLPEPLQRLVTSLAFAQLVRFAIGGFGVTLFAAAVYLIAATWLGLHPLLANTASHMLGMVASYTVHSRWSFKPKEGSEELRMLFRFCIVSGAAYALNSFWVAVTTVLLDLPASAPVPLMIFVTPVLSFLLNRYWVFEATGPSRGSDQHSGERVSAS